MTRRRKREDRRDRGRVEADSGATASATAAGQERPDPLRPWLLGGATALLVARPLVVSDGGPWVGDGQPFAALWIILAVLWTLGALGRPRLGLRFTWIDAAVVAFFAWWTLSAWHGAENGAPRPSVNMLWEGASTLVAFFLLRQLAPVGREARALVVVMIAVGVLLSSIAFHQVLITLPADRAHYKANPQEVLREAGVDQLTLGSPEAKAYEARLESTEPLATFSLTNSLAAYLAPWLILTLGIATLGAKNHPRVRAWLPAAACAAPIAVVLLLTRSRSAWIATAVGAALVRFVLWTPGTNPRKGRWPLVAAMTALVLAIGGGLAIWRPDILEPAFRSFRFRLEYWQSTLAMIHDHPWFGCGPGNFKEYYMLYKLPIASEEIGDPHNFLFEVAASAGLPALMALAATFVGLAWRLSPLSPCRRRRPAVSLSNGGEGSAPTDSRNSGEFRYERAGRWWIPCGALLGVLLAIPLNPILGFNARLEEMIAGMLFGGVAIAILYPWIRDGILPPSLLVIGVTVLLVALLAVGGMSFGGVAGTLWLLLALVLNATDPPAARRNLPWFASFVFFVIATALAVAQNLTAYQPVMKCKGEMLAATATDAEWRHVATADSAIARRKEAEIEQRLNGALDADPWSVEPARELAQRRFDEWRHSGPAATRDPGKLFDFDTIIRDHVVAFNPKSSAAWFESGMGWMEAYRETPSQTTYAGTAVGRFLRATELYPNNAAIRAELAIAMEATGDTKTAKAVASQALQLDDQMPHEDRKLSGELRREMQRISAREKPPERPPPAAPAKTK